jgi:prephenate dehydrogenase
VRGWDPSGAARTGALEVGALDALVEQPSGPVGDVDLVVLAGPVNAIVDTLSTLETDALVTDVAGVKGPVVRAGSRLARFVGGHPMAGRETSGPSAASPSLFRGASWILTTDGSSDADVDEMAAIVTSLGAVPVPMDAASHDAAVAAVSHVPQIVASALVNVVGSDTSALQLAAGGFRDLTRIALSEPGWWTDVLAENRSDVVRLLDVLAAELGAWSTRLEEGDRPAVEAGLESARTTRRGLAPPVSALRVLLEDRPGEIARVGQALALSEADVRDLQLRHATRGGGGILTLSVAPGHEVGLRRELEADGFRILD